MSSLEGFSTGPEDKPKSVIEQALDHLSQFSFVTFEETDEVLYYDNGVYLKGGEVIIRREIENKFHEKATIHVCREVIDHIRRKTYHKRSEFDTNLNIINLKNGLYHVTEDRLEPHTAGYLSLNQKPIVYDPQATCARFAKFIREVIYLTDINTILELMAYTFHRDNPLEIITYLHGYGGNGKSVLSNLLSALHGEDNVSHVSMRTMIERPFGLCELVDKDVNLDPELSRTMLHDTAVIKKITGRERTFVEGKGRPGFHVKLHAKFFFICNQIPEIVDATNADFRRNIYVDFPKTFIDNPDPNLIHKLTSELSGIFNILMDALREVLRTGKISMDEKTIEKRVEKYERLIDPVRAFVKEAFVEDNEEEPLRLDDTVTKAALYECYRHFCKKSKLAAMPENKFGGAMKRLGYPDGREATGDRLHIWKGIRLIEEYALAVKGRQTTIV